MHQGNLDFLADLKKQYPASFNSGSVLELGACSGWNDEDYGTVRSFFHVPRYVGVDTVAGPGVDVVSKAAETAFDPESFDTLVCLSMFEHDPGWADSLRHNLRWIREGGLIILGWGAEGNCPHSPWPWAPVLVADFHAAAATMPIAIHEAFFEHERYTPDCAGAYDVLAFKAKAP